MFDSYDFGVLFFDGEEYDCDLVVGADGRPRPRGYRNNNHLLEAHELRDYIDASTRKLIVGTGESGVLRMAESSLRMLKELGIELVAVKSGEAIKLYNAEPDKKRTVAMIHSTC